MQEIIFHAFLICKLLVDLPSLYHAASDKRKPNITVGNEDMECSEEFEVYGEEVPNGHDDIKEDKDTESFGQGEEEQDDREGSLPLPDASLGDASDASGATPDASMSAMSDASSSYSNYNDVSAPIPHSYLPVYVPPVTTNSVPNSFTPVYTAPLMSTDGFTLWQDLNWNDPVFQMSLASAAAWLQENLSPVLPHPNPPQLPILPHPNPPQGNNKTILEPKAIHKLKVAPKPKAIRKPKATTTPNDHTTSQLPVDLTKPFNKPITNPPGAESSSPGVAAPGGITNDSMNTRTSKRVPVKSRRNELVDAIGTEPSMKQPAQNGPAGAQQKKRAKV
ncbi:uncharacterized protein EDB91DRAFT_1252178 [Suillus paluster]|uniref:uncharacterized protein n=1 Tax=Suillus paluster TaxID=48578 RepID=UPI001B879142|nr:uncharacterized protein EDB91DRAFT_1252178 [Suillus paluster]KAG1731317.1 hypothetical protein EDB91DRAFT_1252178 [Suillus paluster]